MQARRGPLVVALLVVLVAALIAGNAAASTKRAADEGDVATMPPSGVRSASWFCPGAPSGIKTTDEHLTVSNKGDAPADVAVTLYPDGGGPPRTRTVTVAAKTLQTLGFADFGPAGPLIVEAFDDDVAVEASIERAGALAVTPCASRAADHWLFAAGETPRGVAQYLVVQDPFAADAKVDVLLRTSEGLRQPEALQGVDVARRSRAIIPIHDYAVRQPLVAVEVRARIGHVVATNTVVYTDVSGPAGVAVSSGANEAAGEWWFADGMTSDGTREAVVLTNVGSTDTQADVQGYPDGALALGPVTVTLPRDSVVRVPIGGCRGTAPCVPVPARTGYALQVRADAGASVVAEVVRRSGTSQRPGGDAISTGVTSPAKSWLFARSRVAGEHFAHLAFTTTASSEAHVSVTAVRDGVELRPKALQDVLVPAGRRVAVQLAAIKELSRDSALIITSDQPVVVERVIETGNEVTRTAGITVR
jgi:hypothetical protein